MSSLLFYFFTAVNSAATLNKTNPVRHPKTLKYCGSRMPISNGRAIAAILPMADSIVSPMFRFPEPMAWFRVPERR